MDAQLSLNRTLLILLLLIAVVVVGLLLTASGLMAATHGLEIAAWGIDANGVIIIS